MSEGVFGAISGYGFGLIPGGCVDNDSTADVTYDWDALGRRIGRDDGTTASVYIQNGQQTIADYTSGTAATSPTYTYVYASYIDEPVVRAGGSGLRYYHRTQQYSITALTDSSGAIKERYAYDAYGGLSVFDASGTARATTAEGNRYTYTGREYDDVLDLYHYRARMYDSIVGRFCSRDPIGAILMNTSLAGMGDAADARSVGNRLATLTKREIQQEFTNRTASLEVGDAECVNDSETTF